MGTPDFAVASLHTLITNSCNIVGVVTAPDKPAGRGLEMQQSSVKKYAIEKGLKVLQPEKLKDETFLKELRSLNADLQVVVAFRMLPEVVWKMPKHGTINLHASLLPQYRGAAPINHAIINGERETGVSTFLLQHEIDTGNILFREKVNIGEDETAGELHDKLMKIGADLLYKTIQAIQNNAYTKTKQDDFLEKGETLHHAPKIFREDCKIDWSKSIADIHNKIRGLSPYPAAYTELLSPEGKLFAIKLYKAKKEHGNGTGINTDAKTFLKIAGNDGFVNVLELQVSGKKKMGVREFLRGFPINNSWKAL
ncbi:MAG: methionyl-tRNA formyltransferase [Bacteroidia bacterium]|nr:methionyl-tRNA formyltransferase [Bacteroidia bacterium]